jgi:hypothetical protein
MLQKLLLVTLAPLLMISCKSSNGSITSHESDLDSAKEKEKEKEKEKSKKLWVCKGSTVRQETTSSGQQVTRECKNLRIKIHSNKVLLYCTESNADVQWNTKLGEQLQDFKSVNKASDGDPEDIIEFKANGEQSKVLFSYSRTSQPPAGNGSTYSAISGSTVTKYDEYKRAIQFDIPKKPKFIDVDCQSDN